MEKHEENQYNADYIDFFKASTDGDGVLRNNKVTGKDELKLQVGINVKTEYGIATVTKIREDNLVEATSGIMKLYLPMDNIKLYLTPNDCGKILSYAMNYDKEHYTKKLNRTLLSTAKHLYQAKIQTDTGENCSVTYNK